MPPRPHREFMTLTIICVLAFISLNLGCSQTDLEEPQQLSAVSDPQSPLAASPNAAADSAALAGTATSVTAPIKDVKPTESKLQQPVKLRKPQGSPVSQANTSSSSYALDETTKLLFQKTSKAGTTFLLEKGQAPDGSFSKQLSPAVTALCTSALLEHGVSQSNPKILKALAFLETQIRPDGGIYGMGSNLRNYETSVSLMCFNRVNGDGNYDETIKKAIAFLKGLQWDEAEGYDLNSTFYGGQGYGTHKRPDASNTSYFLDALKAVAEDPQSEAFQKAATFMSRCQNLSTPHNTAEWVGKASVDDEGGFIYTAVGEGESKAGETPDGGLRSYASMTYAGLKSLLYSGVDQNDIRVQAAKDWIGRHYDLTTNPGMGQQGLFYYYHIFAKTLAATGEPFVLTEDQKKQDWRADLTRRLSELQLKDGSWTNPADRWFEGDPNLVTAYAMLALKYCDPNSPAKNKDE
ncbi:MAG: terpene cyclase/mutase family protein [Mariniblastus sp.]|nr:terpene cyclase/mutase family protein [Mariniblastus sp.]